MIHNRLAAQNSSDVFNKPQFNQIHVYAHMAEKKLSGIGHMCNMQHEAKFSPGCLVYLGLHLHNVKAAESACHTQVKLFQVPVQTSDGLICCLSFL